jgi:hypothetical protein
MPQLTAFERAMPAGYRMEIGGERAKQQSGFANLAEVLAISLLGIYGALLMQFGNAVKPLLVFAATPYGVDAGIERLRPVLITVGAALLRADWRVGRGHLHHLAAYTGLLQHCGL